MMRPAGCRLVPDPRKVRLRVYQTNSTHKSMSALRQGSMVLVKDVDYHKVEEQFHEAVFTHASTSPNQQLIASLDVARRQMELEGYGLVTNAIEIALVIRREVNRHPLISKYFHMLGADGMIPAEYRQSGFVDFLAPDANWASALRSMQEDEFCLDPTRMTLVCGTAGYRWNSIQEPAGERYNIQLNKTSRNSVLLQIEHQQHAERRGAPDPRADGDQPRDRRRGWSRVARASVRHSRPRVKSLMTDVPGPAELQPLPRCVPPRCRAAARPKGDMRGGFFTAYDEAAASTSGCSIRRSTSA